MRMCDLDLDTVTFFIFQTFQLCTLFPHNLLQSIGLKAVVKGRRTVISEGCGETKIQIL